MPSVRKETKIINHEIPKLKKRNFIPAMLPRSREKLGSLGIDSPLVVSTTLQA